ncbi:MAG: metal-dependent transcriptional regulator [Bacilli bacterium]
MNIYESSEDYLECILILSQKQGNVKAIDIARELNFSKPSVSVAMKKLKESGYLVIGEHGYITLTERGYIVASKTYEKHLLLKEILMKLGVDEKIAKADACKVEHNLSDESFEAIKSFYLKKKI